MGCLQHIVSDETNANLHGGFLLLEQLIEAVLSLEDGDKEFCLYRYGSECWSAEIGNSYPMLRIGETVAEYRGDGATPTKALTELKKLLESAVL